MPLYEYVCQSCGKRFEVIRKFSDPPLEVCTLCGKGPIERQISSPAIQFKGTGWYITDYSQKGKSSLDASSSTTKKEKEKSDSGSSDSASTKTDAPAPATPSKPTSSES